MRLGVREEESVESFTRFFEDERVGAIRLAWLLTHDAALAEDVVQDSFTALFNRFDQIEHPSAYLRRAVVNSVYQRSRKTARERRRLMLVAASAPMSADGPSGGLADAIGCLPLSQRTAIVLRYWGDLDDQAIADAMGVRPGSVRSLLSRGTAQLRKEIRP
jgi:DNA-directed RNA polymerase specialized sigma24 family protein